MGDDPKKPTKPPSAALNPTFAKPLAHAAFTDPSRVMSLDPHPVAPKPGAPVRFDAPPPAVSAANRAQLFGPTYAALSQGYNTDPTLDDLTRAEAVFGVVPALLIASAARPAVDAMYGVIQRIPESLRRPFHKAFGILIDSGLALATGAAQTLLDASVRDFAPGAKLPAKVDLPVDAYSQLDTSCGETAVAMILKYAGEPVLLDDIDTQLPGPAGIPGLVGSAGAAGNNLVIDREFARHGLTAISGSGDLDRLKLFVASGMPVAVGLGWERGGGHFAVVSGFDDRARTVTVRNWRADGKTAAVPYVEFDACWGRRLRMMTAVVPRRDPRLAKLLAQTELRQPSTIAKGFSLADFWVDRTRVYVEGAYRYVTADTDVTVRVSFNSEGLAWGGADELRWLNGSIAVRHRVTGKWTVGFRVDKLSLRKQGEEWNTFRTTPLGGALSVDGPGFSLAVAAERGAVQASLGVALAKRISDLGLQVNVSVNDQGQYNVSGVLAGTW
jgi:hypothetical protein